LARSSPGIAEAAAGVGPVRKQDGRVGGAQFLDGDVPPDAHVAAEAHARVGGDAVERPGHRLGFGMVGRDPVADEPVRGAEALIEVDTGLGHMRRSNSAAA
jgi:hypothetical protein